MIILLHPMGITGIELYEIFSRYIPNKERFYIISPDQGGHGAGGAYLSKKNEADCLLRWLQERHCTRIRFMFGASMGAALAYELIKRPELTIDKVWLDGASFANNAWVFCLLFTGAYRWLIRTARKKPEKVTAFLEKLYPDYFAEMILDCCLKMDMDSAKQIFKACCDYGTVPMPEDMQHRLHIELDSGEKSQLREIRKCFPQADIVRNPGFGHCENMARNTEIYVQRMYSWFAGREL